MSFEAEVLRENTLPTMNRVARSMSAYPAIGHVLRQAAASDPFTDDLAIPPCRGYEIQCQLSPSDSNSVA